MKETVRMSCGHEEEVQLFGKAAEREKKIRYYEEYGLCTDCYRKSKAKEDAEKGLVFSASVLPEIDEKSGEILVSVWFEGDTMPHKDEIKKLGGYRWGERKSAEDAFSAKNAPLCWNKVIPVGELEGEVERARQIGASSLAAGEGLFAAVHYQIAKDKQKEWLERRKAVDSVEKPLAPKILDGRRWNQKIYGKAGNQTIYLDGERVQITDADADGLKRYLEEKEEYERKIKEI